VNVDAPSIVAPPPPIISSADDKEGVSDEDLFKPAPKVDCPICLLPLPLEDEGQLYRSCCGKVICCGCSYAVVVAAEGELDRTICPFCRSPNSTSNEEYIERLKTRAGGDDAVAIYQLACNYQHGEYGLRQNIRKAMKLFLRAGELGCAEAYQNVGILYRQGVGVESDEKKAKYYCELAAIGGDVPARHNLGCFEAQEGNMDRAMKHWMISAGGGYDDSLKLIQQCFLSGHASKDDFEKALRSHKEAKDEVKSDQRDSAAKFHA
jgi:TPR repeat protein